MHKIKTVLRLASLGLSQRQIAASCQLGQATVSDYLSLAERAGLRWSNVSDWDEDRLLTALLPLPRVAVKWRKSAEPDFAAMQREMQTHKHLTLQLLWQEYREQNPDGYRYSRYCSLYRAWLKRQDVVLRQGHRAGERALLFRGPTTGNGGALWVGRRLYVKVGSGTLARFSFLIVPDTPNPSDISHLGVYASSGIYERSRRGKATGLIHLH